MPWYQSILPISFMIASLALGNFYVFPYPLGKSQQIKTKNSVCADFITCAVYWRPCLSSCIEECRYGRIHNTCLMICMLVVTRYFQLYNTHTSGAYRLAAVGGYIVLVSCHGIKSMLLIWWSVTWIWFLRSCNNGLLARYVNLQVTHALGIPGTFFPPPTSKETAS